MFERLKKVLDGRIIETSSLIVAACALFLTVYQARTTSYHNKLSIIPMLQFSIEHINGKHIEISLENVGTGPAIVDTFELAAKKINSLNNTLNEFAELNEIDISGIQVLTAKIEKRTFIRAEQSVSLLKVIEPEKVTDEYKALVHYTSVLPLTVCYRSLYQDEFHVLTDPEYLIEESCANDGAFQVFGKWIKLKVPFSNQVVQSEVFEK
jgi:Asp-tRNA(Asn)/Glu-tRNA(Gln) amidotransferase C subunit